MWQRRNNDETADGGDVQEKKVMTGEEGSQCQNHEVSVADVMLPHKRVIMGTWRQRGPTDKQ